MRLVKDVQEHFQGDTKRHALESNTNPGGLRLRKEKWEYRRKEKPIVHCYEKIGRQI